MTAKLMPYFCDYTQDRHLFAPGKISLEAQTEYAQRLTREGKAEKVYVHKHSWRAKCVEECKFYTLESKGKGTPAFTFEDEEKEVVSE